jgi:hypothetical protein
MASTDTEESSHRQMQAGELSDRHPLHHYLGRHEHCKRSPGTACQPGRNSNSRSAAQVIGGPLCSPQLLLLCHTAGSLCNNSGALYPIEIEGRAMYRHITFQDLRMISSLPTR